MRSAQAADTRAYAELLGIVVPWLRHVIARRRKLLQHADVEDLVQEVILSLHAVRGTYDPDRPFIPWLLAITQNRLVDAIRRFHRRSRHEIVVDEAKLVTFAENSANTMLDADARGFGDPEALKQAVRELPQGQRTAIEMLKLQELSLKEAAAVSGTSVGALKVSVHRAMASLRRTLKK